MEKKTQLKSLETVLAGALRREKMAEASIRQLEAEIEQLNRLVSLLFLFLILNSFYLGNNSSSKLLLRFAKEKRIQGVLK